MIYKTGKRQARHDKRTLRLSAYLDYAKLPPIPDEFGHENVVSDWGMLGNSAVGDCVWAGAAHETMLWTGAASGSPAWFTDQCVLSDYSAVTGFQQDYPTTDNGTCVLDALKYRVNTGILDANGNRHKLGAFVALEPGNFDHLLAAMFLFGAVGIGINFPSTAMEQFNNGQPWDIVPDMMNDGGHYIPLVAKRGYLLNCVTWGKIQPMTNAFFSKQCDEAYAFLSPEYLAAGKSPEGFALADLQADLRAIRA